MRSKARERQAAAMCSATRTCSSAAELTVIDAEGVEQEVARELLGRLVLLDEHLAVRGRVTFQVDAPHRVARQVLARLRVLDPGAEERRVVGAVAERVGPLS
jgi:hypothetical protein